MKKWSTLTRIFNILAAVLMLAILVCQFLPYWTLDDQTLSLGEYVWYPDEYKDFTKHFSKTLDTKLDAGSVAGPHIVFAVGCIIGIFYCLKNTRSVIPAILGLGVGVYSVLELNRNIILGAGDGKTLLLALSIAMVAASVAALVFAVIGRIKKKAV